MSKKPESRLQMRIQNAIRLKYPKAYVRKIHGSEYQSGGIADLLIGIDGLMVMCEVKMPGEEPSELQIADGKEVLASGCYWFVAESVDEAMEGIKRGLDRATAARTKTRR